MIRVTAEIAIPDDEVEISFVRASGPGGQNVNKVASAVQLRFNAATSTALTPRVRDRLIALAGQRATRDGVIVITADSHRSQHLNRSDAIARLKALVRTAAHRPRPRIPTRPTAASKRRRLDTKKRRGDVKRGRGRNFDS